MKNRHKQIESTEQGGIYNEEKIKYVTGGSALCGTDGRMWSVNR